MLSKKIDGSVGVAVILLLPVPLHSLTVPSILLASQTSRSTEKFARGMQSINQPEPDLKIQRGQTFGYCGVHPTNEGFTVSFVL